MSIDPLTWRGKAQLVKDWQDVFTIIDAAGLCVFFSVRNLTTPTRDIRPDGILELLNAATGANYSLTERLFLARAGFSRKDDSLPVRILKEPLPDGPAKGMVCHLEEMLDDYYRFRGWDANGVPLPETLRKLSLPSAI